MNKIYSQIVEVCGMKVSWVSLFKSSLRGIVQLVGPIG